MIRSWSAFSFAAVAVAACATLAAPQASARALGSVSIDTTGPVTPTPHDPWGGVQLCTAHLRRWTANGWQYHMASGYDEATCLREAAKYLGDPVNPWQHNPNPGFRLCQCHSGFNGFLVVGPSGNGPLTVHNLTQEQVQRYDAGMLELRQRYRLDDFAREHEQLLEAIEATTPSVPVPDGR